MARKSGIFGGIIGFILALVAEIPLIPAQGITLSFNFYEYNTSQFYIWGVLIDGEVFGITSLVYPENLITLFMWLVLVYVSLSSIFASFKKANIMNSLKFYNLNIAFISILLILFAIQIILSNLSNLAMIFIKIGLGYYLLLLILVLNSIAKSSLKKGEEKN